jgi:hypothetical protein
MSMFGDYFGSSILSEAALQVDSVVDEIVQRANTDNALRQQSDGYNEYHREHEYKDHNHDEDEDDNDSAVMVELESISSSSSSTVRRRRRRNERERRNRSLSPDARPPGPQPPPPAHAARVRSPVPRHQHFNNTGLANAGVYAAHQQGMNGGPAAAAQMAVDPDLAAALETESFDPMAEDWTDSIEQDRRDGVDFSFCFFCIFSQCKEEREKNRDYVNLLTIHAEHIGKTSLKHLYMVMRQTYEKKIRKHNPLVYRAMALVTFFQHFQEHIVCPEVVHAKSVRILSTLINMTEQDGLFQRDKLTRTIKTIDSKHLKVWLTLQSKLQSLLANKAKTRASRETI